jgi:putative SOS response-associated peptidase YedK
MPNPRRRFLRVAEKWKVKLSYFFEVNEGELFAFAGLWDRWKDLNGNCRLAAFFFAIPHVHSQEV